MVKPYGLTLPLTDLVCYVSQSRRKSYTSGESKDQCLPETGAKVTEVNLFYPLSKDWGAAKSGWGHQKHATYSMSFASYLLNTGSSSRDAKVDGK